MSKNKKSNKALVRNSSVPVRATTGEEKNQNIKKVHFSEDVLSQSIEPVFVKPEYCTLLQLKEEMKYLRSMQGSSRSLPELSKYRHLNFLPEEKIYQDLVGLEVPEEHVVEVRSQPCIKLKKDPELDISKYTKYSLQPEYFFTSSAMPAVKKQKSGFNGLEVYKKIESWSKTRY